MSEPKPDYDAGQALTWTNETRRLRDLVPWEINPRQIKADQARRLRGSKKKFGQPWQIVIGPNGELYDGHQRLKAWGDEWGYDLEVEVRVSNRPLTEAEHKELVVLAHKGATGEWDFDLLANNFEVDDLIEWGFEEYELQIQGIGGSPEFKEYDESVEDEVEWNECPECGHKWPK